MNLAIHKFFMSLFARSIDHEEDEDRADVEYIRACKRENPTVEPLRDVLAELKEKRGNVYCPANPEG